MTARNNAHLVLSSGSESQNKTNTEYKSGRLQDYLYVVKQWNWLDKRWKTKKCVSNSIEVKAYAKRFLKGHRSFPGPGAEDKWYGTQTYKPQGLWNRSAEMRMLHLGESGYPVFRGTSALDRGSLKCKKGGKLSIHHNSDLSTAELLFSHNHFRQPAQCSRFQWIQRISWNWRRTIWVRVDYFPRHTTVKFSARFRQEWQMGHGLFSVLVKRSGTERKFYKLEGQWNLPAALSWCQLPRQRTSVLQSFTALDRGFLKKKVGAVSNHQVCKSAQYLRSDHGLVWKTGSANLRSFVFQHGETRSEDEWTVRLPIITCSLVVFNETACDQRSGTGKLVAKS